MSIRRACGFFSVACNCCGAITAGELSFREALSAARSAGWERRKTGGGWENICPDCMFTEKGYDEEGKDCAASEAAH